MSRLVLLVVLIVLIVGALVLLSTVPRQRPTHTIEIVVPQGANGH